MLALIRMYPYVSICLRCVCVCQYIAHLYQEQRQKSKTCRSHTSRVPFGSVKTVRIQPHIVIRPQTCQKQNVSFLRVYVQVVIHLCCLFWDQLLGKATGKRPDAGSTPGHRLETEARASASADSLFMERVAYREQPQGPPQGNREPI